MSDLKAAEAALLALEKYGHAVAQANVELCNAKFSGDPAIIAPFQTKYDEAVKAQAAAGIDDLDIQRAAELVLALRGEQHTEAGVLPPNHGIRTMQAERVLANALAEKALGTGKQEAIDKAGELLAEAASLDAAEKELHMTEGHERALAEHAGE